MKHQLKTIRSKLSPIADGDWDNEMYVIDRAKQALTALSELERIAGEQEQSLAFYKRRCDALQQWQSKMRDPERTIVCDILANGCTLEPAGDRYAAPPAQQPQYEAGDMASAHNDGFRAGVASVAQQQVEPFGYVSQHTNGSWEFSPTAAGVYPDTAKSITAVYTKQPQAETEMRPADERDMAVYRAIAEGYHAAQQPQADSIPVAAFDRLMALCDSQAQRIIELEDKQPQARPDFSDEWTGYLKDGETPFERFMRERKDMQSVLKLYQRALEENERLKAQQPQAEAHKPLFADLIDKHPGLREELKAMDEQPQTKQALADALYALQVPHVACQDGLVTRCMCRKCVIKRGDEALAAPQQAEAVATVIEELEPDGQGWCAKVRWLFNPVPVGEMLLWRHQK